MSGLITLIIFLIALFTGFSSNENTVDMDDEHKPMQYFSHVISARAAPPPKAQNRLRVGQVRRPRTTTEKPLSLADANKYKNKIKRLLDMEYEALELEIKYFLTYLKDLIKAKKKESTEIESQEKSMPKTFYDYMHNPPDSVYIFIAVCIIVIFVLCILCYILYLAWRHYCRKRKKRRVEYEEISDGNFKSKVSDKFSGFKYKLGKLFKRNRSEKNGGETNGNKRGRKLQRKETLEDVILRTSEYDSTSDQGVDDIYLREKLLRTGESAKIDQRLARDRFR